MGASLMSGGGSSSLNIFGGIVTFTANSAGVSYNVPLPCKLENYIVILTRQGFSGWDLCEVENDFKGNTGFTIRCVTKDGATRQVKIAWLVMEI